MRNCEDCHNAELTHTWLPYLSVHLEHLSCEACHIAETRAPAIRAVDWTMISPEGTPRVEWRGIAGSPRDVTSLVTGFRPTTLPKQTLDGEKKLSPYNLISAWYWVAGGPTPRPVRAADLQAALLMDGGYHPDVLAQFDANSDGKLSLSERIIDNPQKQDLVQQRLASIGVEGARIEAEVKAYGLHHGVGPGRTAIRDCKQCHAANSRLGEEMVLASYAPGGVVPRLVGDGIASLSGAIQIAAGGPLVFQPKTREADLYVLGHDRWPWLDALGVLSLLAALVGVVIHTGMRIGFRTRRGSQEQDHENSSGSQ
jgi:hypothetical protein